MVTAFYSAVRRERLESHAHQWSSLLCLRQERIAYQKAMELVARGSTCLDWGCGNGHFSVFLARSGYRTHAFALDEAPPLIANNPEISYTRGMDVVKLPYAEASFDAVFGLGVLEHVYERGGNEAGSLAELGRILRPGGLLFIFHLPNRWSWLESAKGMAGRMQHERRYGRGHVLRLLAGRAMSVIEYGRYHLLPRMALNRLPRAVTDSPSWCAAIDGLEDALSVVLRPICQNWYFILRRH